MTTFTAGYNMPGYLPESEPAAFATFDEAKRYIIEEIKNAEDNASTEEEAEDLCAAAEDVNLESGPFLTVGPLADGFVYWVSFEA